jgi:hypothetical protein
MTVMRYPTRSQLAIRPIVYAWLLRCSLPLLVLMSICAASQHVKSNASVFDGQYGFGPATEGIVQHHRLGAINTSYGWWCFAGRMPMIPVLGAASYWLSPGMTVFLVLKNLAFWSMWIYAFLRLKVHYRIPDKFALVTVLLLLLEPYVLSIAGWADVEEGFLFPLIALLFSLLLTLEGSLSALTLGLTMAAIFLTKSSMFPLCALVSLWIAIKQWRQPRLIAIPLVTLALAMLGWGYYVQSVSGVFAFGADTSSFNGWNFYKGNNPYAYALYPRVTLDALDFADYAHRLLPFVAVHNEWELSHAQSALARKYVLQNPGGVLKLDLKKLFVACCDVRESPEKTKGHTRRSVVLSNTVSHLTLAGVFVFVVINALRRQLSQAEILAALLTTAYLLPYFLAFLYMRHMVPIYGVIALTAAVQLTRWRAPVPDAGVPFGRASLGANRLDFGKLRVR